MTQFFCVSTRTRAFTRAALLLSTSQGGEQSNLLHHSARTCCAWQQRVDGTSRACPETHRRWKQPAASRGMIHTVRCYPAPSPLILPAVESQLSAPFDFLPLHAHPQRVQVPHHLGVDGDLDRKGTEIGICVENQGPLYYGCGPNKAGGGGVVDGWTDM